MSKSYNFTDFEDQPISLCCGEWIATTEDGIYRLVGKKNDITERVGFQPILITKRIINSENDTEKFEIAYKDQDKWKKRRIPRTLLFNKNLVNKLCDYGIDVSTTNATAFVAYMTELYGYNKDKIPIEYSINHLGWANDDCNEMIPYSDKIYCDPSTGVTKYVEAFHSRGKEQEWYKRIKEIRKDEKIRMYIDASFSAPLIKLLGGLGFILHFWGGTGNGKSVALYAALSVWGDPNILFITLTSTNFSIELIAHVLQNFPMAGDELTQLDGKNMTPQDVAYLFSNGHGKNRGTKEGDLQETKEWKTLMLSTGEGPFVDETADGGASARVLEIESTQSMYPSEPDLREFVSFLKKNYGFAGKKFIDYIISVGKENLIERYSRESNEFMRKCKEKNLNEKQAVSMSLIKFADELLKECYFLDEELLEDETYFRYIKSKDVVATHTRAYELVIQTAMRDKNTLLITGDESNYFGNDDINENRYGKINGVLDKKNNRIFLYDSYVNEILRKENPRWSFNQFKKSWVESGVLIQGENGRYTKKHRRLEKRAVCLIINADNNEDIEDELMDEPPF